MGSAQERRGSIGDASGMAKRLLAVRKSVRGRDKMLRNSPCTDDTDNQSVLRVPERRRDRSWSFVVVRGRLCSFKFVPSSSRTEQV